MPIVDAMYAGTRLDTSDSKAGQPFAMATKLSGVQVWVGFGGAFTSSEVHLCQAGTSGKSKYQSIKIDQGQLYRFES